MHTASRHRRADQPAVFWGVVGIAVISHAVLLVLLDVVGIHLIGEGFSVVSNADAATTKAAADEPELKPTCSGDVILAMTARAALCMAPWRGDVAGCGDDLEMQLWMDLSGCRARDDDKIAAVQMVNQRSFEKLNPIDPEQLLIEELQQQQKPPTPPPPVPQPQQQQPQPKPPAPPPPQKPKQVAETVKPKVEEEPNNARLLSEYNTKVEKQKVARGSRMEEMVAKSKPEELKAKKDVKEDPSVKEKPPELPPGKNEKAPDAPGKLSMRKPGVQTPSETPQDARTKGAQNPEKGPIVADGFVPRHGEGAIEQQKRDARDPTVGENGAGGGTPPVPNLKPTKDQLERALGGGNVDHLEDVDNGDETALNSKRWVYASFFNRLKRQVAQNWDPQTVWRRSDPQGTHYGFKTRVTEVRVSLNAKGDLSKIVVTNPSGSNELDEEAVRSFHAAAPFPNPPDGLVQKDGLITFAFSFYFEIGQSHTSWRVIRQ